MVGTIFSVGFRIILWGLAAAGLVTLIVTAMTATPIRRPPELASISKTAGAVDRSDMPGLDRFHARDGTGGGCQQPDNQAELFAYGNEWTQSNCLHVCHNLTPCFNTMCFVFMLPYLTLLSLVTGRSARKPPGTRH